MIFEYISGIIPLNGKTPKLGVKDIAKIIDTREDGTLLENIKNLNSNKEVLRAIPSLEFEVDFPKMHSFSEIEEEINANRPMIAWILMSDNHRGFKHSVVVTGLDIEKGLIYYNDPIYGKMQQEIGKFISMWEKVDTVLIKIKIGKREHRLLDEWVKTRGK